MMKSREKRGMLAVPHEERPRERLLKHGAAALSSAELIAIILGSGFKDKPVLELSQEIVTHFGGLEQLGQASFVELCAIKGLGPAKAIQLLAAFGLGSRAAYGQAEDKQRVDTPQQAHTLLRRYFEGEKREKFVAIMLDARGQVITIEVISVGTLTNTLVHPRELFYPAIRHKAATIVVAHNHPSGDPTPSNADIQLTRDLLEAGQVLGIPVQDHLIVAGNSYVSLKQLGKLQSSVDSCLSP